MKNVLFCSVWKSAYVFVFYGSRTFLLSMDSYFFALHESRTFLLSMELVHFLLTTELFVRELCDQHLLNKDNMTTHEKRFNFSVAAGS